MGGGLAIVGAYISDFTISYGDESSGIIGCADQSYGVYMYKAWINRVHATMWPRVKAHLPFGGGWSWGFFLGRAGRDGIHRRGEPLGPLAWVGSA